MHEYLTMMTALVVASIVVINFSITGSAFINAAGLGAGPASKYSLLQNIQSGKMQVFAEMQDVKVREISCSGLLGYGAAFGVAMAALHGFQRTARTKRQAKTEGIEVAEKTETKVVPYLQNIPRTIIEKDVLDKLLSTLPREKWDDPPENSYLYTLKVYAETYGEGKATKMGWWDYWYLKINQPSPEEFPSGEEDQAAAAMFRRQMQGYYPMGVPGPNLIFGSGVYLKQGQLLGNREIWSGDQYVNPFDIRAAQNFINNMAFYRDGLEPWQRGLEIGIAHGYWLLGPFTSLGPLRSTPEGPTVGLLCATAVIGLVSVGGLIFASTIRPALFDKPGQPRASGFTELINWHALGGMGGAAFAHILITVFAAP
jgi:photosystem I subunit 11